MKFAHEPIGPKVFTDKHVLLSTLLGSSLAGGYFMHRNSEILPEAEQGGVYIAVGVALVGLAVLVVQTLNHTIAPFGYHLPEIPMISIFQMVAMKLIYNNRQKKQVEGVLAGGEVDKAGWKEVLLISIASLALVWIAISGIGNVISTTSDV